MKTATILLICFLAISVLAIFLASRMVLADQPTLSFAESLPQVPASVRPILARACLDCHSAETQWPWYNRLPVASWLIQRHVDQGREKLDFSAWASDKTYDPSSVEINEICEAVSTGTMPMWSYRLMHPAAVLSEADKHNFCAWADQVQHSEEEETK